MMKIPSLFFLVLIAAECRMVSAQFSYLAFWILRRRSKGAKPLAERRSKFCWFGYLDIRRAGSQTIFKLECMGVPSGLGEFNRSGSRESADSERD